MAKDFNRLAVDDMHILLDTVSGEIKKTLKEIKKDYDAESNQIISSQDDPKLKISQTVNLSKSNQLKIRRELLKIISKWFG